jgi:hypothetical protein
MAGYLHQKRNVWICKENKERRKAVKVQERGESVLFFREEINK